MREFGSEHPAIMLPDGYFDSLNEFGNQIYLRSGREALLYVATICKPAMDNPVILFPAYCCWSMSAPFEKAGWKLVYYRLNEDLTVNINYLHHLLVQYQPQAVLVMNYYGSAPTDKAIEAVKDFNQHCLTIEDFSHCTFSLSQIFNTQTDYYVTSIRKSIGVCDGAVVVSKHPLPRDIVEKEDPALSDLRFKGQTMKGKYAFTHRSEDKELFLSMIREGEEQLNHFDRICPITQRGMQMLKVINAESICFARKENFNHLFHLLKGKIEMPKAIERAGEGVPFSLPILIDNRDELQKNFAQKGLYAPVLWPLCDEARAACPISAKMEDKMLSIPIDQRYDYSDVEEIAEIILTTA